MTEVENNIVICEGNNIQIKKFYLDFELSNHNDEIFKELDKAVNFYNEFGDGEKISITFDHSSIIMLECFKQHFETSYFVIKPFINEETSFKYNSALNTCRDVLKMIWKIGV